MGSSCDSRRISSRSLQPARSRKLAEAVDGHREGICT
jgi:hypothetical protein